MNGWDWGFNIVPFESPLPSRQPAPSYEIPWWGDTINRAIERAAQVASVQSAGYPPYPQFPAPQPMPLPYPVQQQQPPSGAGIQLSTNTLMLIVGGFLLFTLGRRR